MGCILAGSENAKITQRRVLSATLEPATNDSYNERYNKHINAKFPGNIIGQPIFISEVSYNNQAGNVTLFHCVITVLVPVR
jgi:hypothetical protein